MKKFLLVLFTAIFCVPAYAQDSDFEEDTEFDDFDLIFEDAEDLNEAVVDEITVGLRK